MLVPEVEAEIMAKNGFLLQSLWVVARLEKVILRVEVAQEMEQSVLRSLLASFTPKFIPSFVTSSTIKALVGGL